eukprot:CAMPEP_0172837188 /NCGR_PEP_ID=MMETSP1075-20121228/27012_1 /TAXON_ID=2916 /ORGANISM="Ceratium fusus, Strain PA161109" /LENGTH=83 /DNA_ID=CAMNT_0013680537 /DNA_START=64 /DNA_END=312 /DNA_ORIENTATION=-
MADMDVLPATAVPSFAMASSAAGVPRKIGSFTTSVSCGCCTPLVSPTCSAPVAPSNDTACVPSAVLSATGGCSKTDDKAVGTG